MGTSVGEIAILSSSGKPGFVFNVEKIKALVEAAIPGAHAEVRDMTGTADHFEVVVVSAAFNGKSPVERHRMVYAAIGSAVGNEIHALALKTLTPEEKV